MGMTRSLSRREEVGMVTSPHGGGTRRDSRFVGGGKVNSRRIHLSIALAYFPHQKRILLPPHPGIFFIPATK